MRGIEAEKVWLDTFDRVYEREARKSTPSAEAISKAIEAARQAHKDFLRKG